MISKFGESSDNTRSYSCIYIVCGLLICLIALLDMVSPLGIAIGALYVGVVLLSFLSPSIKFTYVAALISSALIIGMYIYKPSVADLWKAFFNRSISLIIVWVATYLTLKAKKAEQKLIAMANYDFLTGLLNRHEMHNRLSLECSRAHRRGEPLSIIMFDIDHFKNINDTYGHIIGDKVLKEVANKLREGVREYDLICRFGGEEFLIIVPEANVQRAHELAERLRKHVSENPLKIGVAPPITVTISGGVTQLVQGESVEDMISRADAALYQAKELGRDRVTAL